MRLIRCLLVLVLAFACLLSSASAQPLIALAPLLDALSSAETYSLDLRADLLDWPALEKESLTVLRSWLSDAKLTLVAGKSAGKSALIFNQGGAPIFSLYLEQAGASGKMLVSTEDQGTATAYSSASSLPWQTLLGLSPALPSPGRALEALNAFADAALPVLTPYEQAVKTSVSVKNVGRSASQLVYALSKTEARQVFEAGKATLIPLLKQALSCLLPASAQETADLLDSAQVAGALTLKRFLTKEGRDLGLQLTGTFLLGGVARKLTLFYGYSDTGFYLSVKFPALKGRDTVTFQTALRFREDGLSGDWEYKAVAGKNTLAAEGAVGLKAVPEAAGHRLSGEITAKVKTTGAENTSFTCTLTPDLLLQGAVAEGRVRLARAAGKVPLCDLVLSLSFKPAQAPEAPPAMAEVNLDTASEQEKELAATRVKTLLLSRLKTLLLALPREPRLLLLHDLGRERRTDGRTISPAHEPGLLFTVEEPTTPPPTKEETP